MLAAKTLSPYGNKVTASNATLRNIHALRPGLSPEKAGKTSRQVKQQQIRHFLALAENWPTGFL
jgi:hypothetical protein